jgi:cyclase
VEFKDPKYVGDPINAVKIFNEKEVDELIVLDIDASVEGRGPNFELIKNLAIECRMPFCYGGGVTNVDQAKEIISLGAEKVALSTSAINNPELITKIGKAVGVQSVVVVIDVKKRKGFFSSSGYDIYIKNGKEKVEIELDDLISKFNALGVGEILINSIDQDGKMSGYDMHLVEKVRNSTDVPMTVLGGAGNLEHIENLISKYKIIGAAAGSLFVFKGKYKAVLINYPDPKTKLELTKINKV